MSSPPSGFDPYADLGLKRGASDEEVKAAFRRLAHVYHPDKQVTADGRASAEFNFNKITAARNRLLGNHHGSGMGLGGGGGAGPMGSGMRARNRLSNVSFALVLTLPLCLIGVVSHWAFPSDHNHLTGKGGGETIGRVNGVLEPPVNSWIREDVADAGRRTASSRPDVMTRLSRRIFGAEDGTRATAMRTDGGGGAK